MEIREVKIFSNRIDEQEDFYKNVVGFQCVRESNSLLEINTKENKLILEKSIEKFYYHFAFLIPTGSLNSAINFVEEKSIELLPFQKKKIIQFDTGRSIYFYDKDGNIVEFIERPTLNYPSNNNFSIENILKLNEIGLPVSEPKRMAERLTNRFGIGAINKKDFNDQFCWVGDYNGVIIVVKNGRNWFPTEKPGITNDFVIKYFDQGKEYKLSFENKKIINWL